MKKVLLPIDQSPASQLTLEWVKAFLNPTDVEIFLFTIVESSKFSPSSETIIDILNKARQSLETVYFNVRKTDYVLNKRAAEAICEYANANNVDQIIMGAHGNSLSKMIIGSVSKEVFKTAKQPVFILSNKGKPSLAINTPQNVDINLKNGVNVLYPVDDSVACQKTIESTLNHLNKGKDKLHLLHVIPMRGRDSAYSLELDEANLLLEEIQQSVESQGFHVVRATHSIGNPADEIQKYADEQSINTIIIGSHGKQGLDKFFMGSVSEDVFKNAQQTVLLIRNTPKPSVAINSPSEVKL
jgi:nucleotide-binding universal stress UspA family protein